MYEKSQKYVQNADQLIQKKFQSQKQFIIRNSVWPGVAT